MQKIMLLFYYNNCIGSRVFYNGPINCFSYYSRQVIIYMDFKLNNYKNSLFIIIKVYIVMIVNISEKGKK